jgi:UDP-N-acetylglucosamine 1-carboxyvinyltransferase
MDKLLIRGGRQLHGEVRISGAKNAALPELCAALLTDRPVVLENVPRLQDVATMLTLIRNMGVTVERGEQGRVQIDSSKLSSPEAPYELVKTMRASVLALGPLLARFGEATVSCRRAAPSDRSPWTSTSRACRRWGRDRGGAQLHDRQTAQRDASGCGAQRTDMITVTGTENFLMAAALAEGNGAGKCGQEPRSRPGRNADPHGERASGHGSSRIVNPATNCRLHPPRGGRPDRGQHFPVRRGSHGGDVVLHTARPITSRR